MNNLVSHDGHL